MIRISLFVLLAAACTEKGTDGLDSADVDSTFSEGNNSYGDAGSPGEDDVDADGEDDGDADGETGSIPQGTVSLNAGRVIDPKLPSDPFLEISSSTDEREDCAFSLHIDNGIGQIRTLEASVSGATNWDGRDDDGHAFDPGPADIALIADCSYGERAPIDETRAFVIRLGLTMLDFMNPTDEDENHVGLAFHKRNLFETEVSPIGDRPEYMRGPAGVLGSSLDQDDGSPRPVVSTWPDPDVPPWADGEVPAHNVPAAFIADSTMHATVAFGDTAVSQARNIAVNAWGPDPDSVPEIRLADGHGTVRPNNPFHLPLGRAAATMGKHIQTIDWGFESQGDDGTWHPIPGTLETEHVVYTLAGPPALLDGSDFGASPAVPWVGVLEDTAGVMEGVPATVDDTLDALRDYLFNHDYIIYDPSTGAYTEYEGEYMFWSSITAQMSAFLDRRGGLRLYCHSMSCMLSALAGTHGVEAEQIVLGVGFYTNYARAAGTDSWGRWSFNSHSVVTPDDGATIWDSSIALDGDDEPGDDSSIEEIMPRGMDGDEYMWRLTYDDVEIINQGLCYME